MKTILILITITCSAISAVAQFNEAAARSMFSDVKAYRKGDVITILIVEEAQADNSASTGSERSTELSINGGAKVGSSSYSGGASIGTGNNFSGKGTTNRSESVRARLSARIIEADNLNAMKVEGKRTVNINGETQTITITGYLRFIDIQADNTVMSYNLSDLVLNYNGEGVISKSQEPGLFTKFLRFLF